MNNLLMVLVQALRQHRWLCLFGVAYIFSSVGNGLTQTLILGQLLRWHGVAAAPGIWSDGAQHSFAACPAVDRGAAGGAVMASDEPAV